MSRKKKTVKLYHQPYYKFMAYLKENRIKLKDIADIFGHTVQTISMKNHGKADYTMSEINVMCDRFGISPELFRTKKVS